MSNTCLHVHVPKSGSDPSLWSLQQSERHKVAAGYCCCLAGSSGLAQWHNCRSVGWLGALRQAGLAGGQRKGEGLPPSYFPISSNEITRERIKSALFHFSVISVPCEFMGMETSWYPPSQRFSRRWTQRRHKAYTLLISRGWSGPSCHAEEWGCGVAPDTSTMKAMPDDTKKVW